jgi:hypothetical protein
MRQEAIISLDRSYKTEHLQTAGRHSCNLDQLERISRDGRTTNSGNSVIYLLDNICR